MGGAFLARLGRRSIARRERRESPNLSSRPIAGIPGDPRHLSELRLDEYLARSGSLSSENLFAQKVFFVEKCGRFTP